ncbi:MAG: hypothetical protein DDT19_02554 [Syntrophomonadaceae bacterium]|nr:hypothetical protein [Bacillota bacterium]
MKERRMFLTKALTLHECFRKYYLSYHAMLQPKATPKPFVIGRIFHEMAKTYIEQDVSRAVRLVQTAEINEDEQDNLLLMLEALVEKFEHGDDNLKLPLTILGAEQTVGTTIGDWVWYIKTDLTFLEEDRPWKGEYKTTSGYGAATATFYHNSPQTLIYQYLLLQQMPNLVGSKYFIVTKTKAPKCIIEPIFITKDKLKWAWHSIQATLSLASTVESEKLYIRQFSHCKTLQRECQYYPLCFHYNALAGKPEEGTSEAYLEEVLRLYEVRDPEEHLGLEGSNG